jgi:glutamine amidotransferase
MNIVIIDYGMGNLGSIANMLRKTGFSAVVSSDESTVKRADKLILPGVGAFDSGMTNLAQLELINILNFKVLEKKTPILGVCLGMQLLCKRSEEGQMSGLGWLDARAIRFKFENNCNNHKIPNMGWNTILVKQPHALFSDLDVDNRFYFVHSYHVVCSDINNVLAVANYGFDFTAAVVKDNIMGVQFHPEKSHKYGMRLYKNFVERF